MAKQQLHLHRYKRVKLGNKGYSVYKCTKPNCPHMIDVRLSENKIIECSRCGNPMLLTKAKMDLAKPHCDDCTRSTKPKDEIVGALEDLFKEKDANDNNE